MISTQKMIPIPKWDLSSMVPYLMVSFCMVRMA